MADRAESAPGGLEILSPCPHCGGANTWRLLQTLLRCSYCDSALWWPRRADRSGLLVAEDAIEGPEGLLDVLATLDAMRERARIAGLRSPGPDDDLALRPDAQDDPTLPPLHEIKAQRRHLFALHEHRSLLVPYLLTASTLVFHALGRSREAGRKEHRSLFFTAEEIVPAYPEPWDFRDRGLWVARQRFRPLDDAALSRGPMRMRETGSDPDEALRPWRNRRQVLEPDMDPIHFLAEAFESDRFWVFRPFHLVRATSPLEAEWLLLDGQFATVAGRPDPEEVRRILAGSWETLPASEARAAAPLAIPFRCPECGQDVPLDEAGTWQLCRGCGRVLEPGRLGLEVVPQRTIDRRQIPWWPRPAPSATAWLPFWRFRGRFRLGGESFDDLSALSRALVPAAGAVPVTFPPSCGAWLLPAFDVLTAQGHDAWAFEIAAELTALRPEPQDARLGLDQPVGPKDTVLPPAHRAGAFARSMPRLVLTLLPPAIQARLNPVALRKLDGARFETTGVDLVFVPAPVVEGRESRVLGPRRSVLWERLRDRSWPPDACRTVRRWLQKAKGEEASRKAPLGVPRLRTD